jgi:hypothetical protein
MALRSRQQSLALRPAPAFARTCSRFEIGGHGSGNNALGEQRRAMPDPAQASERSVPRPAGLARAPHRHHA